MSRYRRGRIVAALCADLTAGRAALLPGFDRNTLDCRHRIFVSASERVGSRLRTSSTASPGSTGVIPAPPTARRGRASQARPGRGAGKAPSASSGAAGGSPPGPPPTRKDAPGPYPRPGRARRHPHAGRLRELPRPRRCRLRRAHAAQEVLSRQDPVRRRRAPHQRHRSLLVLHQAPPRQFSGTARIFERPMKECAWRWRKNAATPQRRTLEIARLKPSKVVSVAYQRFTCVARVQPPGPAGHRCGSRTPPLPGHGGTVACAARPGAAAVAARRSPPASPPGSSGAFGRSLPRPP